MVEWIFVAYLLMVDGKWAAVPPLVMRDEAACKGMEELVEKAGPGPLLNIDPDAIQAWETYCLSFEVRALPIPKAPPVGPVAPPVPQPTAVEIAI